MNTEESSKNIEIAYPTGYLGRDGNTITDTAFGLGGRHLVTVSESGDISVYGRSGRRSEWVHLQTWQIPDKHALNKVVWAPPVHGLLLAAGGKTGKISLWAPQPGILPKGGSVGAFHMQGSVQMSGPVTALRFAPREQGLALAAASATQVRVFRPSMCGDSSWQLENKVAVNESGNFTSLAWQPSGTSLSAMLLVGSHSNAKLWMYRSERMCWQAVSTLLEAEVETVAWANSVNRPKELIAVGSGKVARVFGLTGHANKPQVEELAQLTHSARVLRLEWHPQATQVAVTLASSEVHLWRPSLAGEWKLVQKLIGTPQTDMP